MKLIIITIIVIFIIGIGVTVAKGLAEYKHNDEEQMNNLLDEFNKKIDGRDD